jgi:Flp pilus assembly protein TadD
MRILLFALALQGQLVSAENFDLQYGRLATALSGLSTMNKKIVDEAISHIRNGENNLALVRLFELNKENPKNSSLRILTAYTLLRTGDLLGALDHAKQGEGSPNGDAYKCWFLAKIAFVTGDKEVCKRELGHAKHGLKNDKVLLGSVTEMEKQLKKK